MNARLIRVWQAIESWFDSPAFIQTHQSDRWHERRPVFIYPFTFFLISTLADIAKRADGDSCF